ncbi:MAG: hypothetical protein HKO77_05345 [Gemmatimonadetes bacterium]|nr:hypothetical protein [Gemmatimonadota bacterium]
MIRAGRQCFVLLFVAVLAQCTTSRRPPADPFAGGGGASGGGVSSYEVVLEVACERCRVSYQVGPRGEQDVATGSWRQRMRLRPLQRTAIRLTATGHENGGSVRGVRIVVNDETVAEAGCGACDATATHLGNPQQSFTVETVVPR